MIQRLLQFCLDLGVREWCVCAGSRNSEVLLALQAHRDLFESRPFFDERAAAFFALGRIKATSRPVAVLTTSGTAAAELLPAAIEAHYQALPLLLVTADRPARFRGSGAPQAIEQVGLFSAYAPTVEFSDESPVSEADLIQSLCHPLHLNLRLEEPRGKPPRFSLDVGKRESPLSSPAADVSDASRLQTFLQDPDPLVVFAGCLTQAESDQLAPFLTRLGAPVLAESTSNLAGRKELGSLLIRGGDHTLRRLAYRRLLRFGGVPSCRAWRDLETQPHVEVLSVSRRPFTGLARASTLLPWPRALPEEAAPSRGPGEWQEIDEQAGRLLSDLLRRYPACEMAMLDRQSRSIPENARLFLGNSLPIREWNLVGRPARNQEIVANRGANGIDGNLSTFFGFVAGTNDERESWGVFGDLTTLYDLSAPYAIRPSGSNQLHRIVVINNQGGKIFRLLPNFQGLGADELELIENPHLHDFRAWADSWKMTYVLIDSNRPEIPALPRSPAVVEVRPDLAQSDAFWNAWNA